MHGYPCMLRLDPSRLLCESDSLMLCLIFLKFYFFVLIRFLLFFFLAFNNMIICAFIINHQLFLLNWVERVLLVRLINFFIRFVFDMQNLIREMLFIFEGIHYFGCLLLFRNIIIIRHFFITRLHFKGSALLFIISLFFSYCCWYWLHCWLHC